MAALLPTPLWILSVCPAVLQTGRGLYGDCQLGLATSGTNLEATRFFRGDESGHAALMLNL